MLQIEEHSISEAVCREFLWQLRRSDGSDGSQCGASGAMNALSASTIGVHALSGDSSSGSPDERQRSCLLPGARSQEPPDQVTRYMWSERESTAYPYYVILGTWKYVGAYQVAETSMLVIGSCSCSCSAVANGNRLSSTFLTS